MEPQKENKKITNIDELAVMIHNSFQSNQEYMDKKFGEVKNELKEEIKGVDRKLNAFIDRYDEDKLPMRVDYIENVLNLPKK